MVTLKSLLTSSTSGDADIRLEQQVAPLRRTRLKGQRLGGGGDVVQTRTTRSTGFKLGLHPLTQNPTL